MRLKHYFVEKIAHSSYLLAGKESCAVIDPQRDVDIYINEARAMGVTITHILQTHLHADFVSGHMDLARRTGAKIYVSAAAECTFAHEAVKEGDRITLEGMALDVWETPGHTPEHLSYVLTDTSRSQSPVGVFVGDTLFVGDVGRPDLFPDMAVELAEKLYHSLHERLLKLPDYVEVYPAHGAGSLCGRAMGAKWRTTIGYERRFNTTLQIPEKADFIRSLIEEMPPAPDHFRRCSDINRRGPALLAEMPQLQEFTETQFHARMKNPGTLVLDTRSYLAFGGQHIPGAWNIDLNGNFPIFSGWVLPPGEEILLVAEDRKQAVEATVWARRVGVDPIAGYLDGGMANWLVAGLKTDTVPQISAEILHKKISGTSGFILLDVRAPGEYQDNHINGAINIPVADLRTRHRELNPEQTMILMCSSGNRSSLGTSILKQHGFHDVINLAGGMAGYSAAGYTRECRPCANPHGSRFFTSFSEVKKHWTSEA